MRSDLFNRKTLLFAVAVVLLCGTLYAQSEAPKPTAIDAVWKEQEVTFTFLGLEVAYACDVMEARIKMLLRHVGAADDIEVTGPPCPGGNEPQKRHRIKVKFSTLVPATEGDTDIVKAEWTEVELGKWNPRSIDDGECELLEHFQKYLLPLIEHEVIEGKTRCSAAKHSIVGRLKLRVLKPVVAEATAEDVE